MLGLDFGHYSWVIVAMRLLFLGLILLSAQLLLSVMAGSPLPGLVAAIGLFLATLLIGPFSVAGWILAMICSGISTLVGLLLTGGLSSVGLQEPISKERRSRVLSWGLFSALGALLLGWAVLFSTLLP